MKNSEVLTLFHTVTPKIIENAGIEFRFISAIDPSSEKTLTIDNSGNNNTSIVDEDSSWSISNCGVKLFVQTKIEKPSILFDTNGIMPPGSTIGIGITYHALNSNYADSVKVGCIKQDDEPFSQITPISIPKNTFNSNIYAEVYLFVEEAPIKKFGYAEEKGMILGIIKHTTISSSLSRFPFPVLNVCAGKDEPLWWVECEWTDAFHDLFDEDSICIKFNKDNVNFKKINPNDHQPNVTLLAEIISNAMFTILATAIQNKDEWSQIIGAKNIQEETIAYFLSYIYNALHFNFDNLENLSKSIRSYVYKEFRL